ncbi:MAG: hypothetical protein LBS11_06540 [Oscillospiraceae bacterium]|jgi:hypothetical protein|nr:hypothetical protein [Oscillospiraceae bacterium]
MEWMKVFFSGIATQLVRFVLDLFVRRGGKPGADGAMVKVDGKKLTATGASQVSKASGKGSVASNEKQGKTNTPAPQVAVADNGGKAINKSIEG